MAVGQERQDRAGDDGVARERLDVVVVEPLDEAVKLLASASRATPTAAQAIASAGSPMPARKPIAIVAIAATALVASCWLLSSRE